MKDTREFYPSLSALAALDIVDGISQSDQFLIAGAWKYIQENELWKHMQGRYGRCVRRLVEDRILPEDRTQTLRFGVVHRSIGSSTSALPFIDSSEYRDWFEGLFGEPILAVEPIPYCEHDGYGGYIIHSESKTNRYCKTEGGLLLVIGQYLVGCKGDPLDVHMDDSDPSLNREFVILNGKRVYLDEFQEEL